MKLGDIVSLETLQEIQDCFTEATGFAAILVDYKGQPLLQYSNFSCFCSKIRENEYYNDKCHLSDAHGSLEAVRSGKVCIYRCHAGLVDFAIPIIVNGDYIASMMCGQVLVDDESEVTTEFLRPSTNIFSDSPELLELYKKIPVMSYKRVIETANLFCLMLNHIVEQYLSNQKNTVLLREQKEKIELERLYRSMEIRYYTSQVKPHFLFNALNVAARQAYLENAEKTQEIIYALADIYRMYLLDSNMLITVAEEMRNVKNYMFIQSVRFGELLKFTTDIPEDIQSAKLPPMTLQIFVENAVRHGLEPKEGLGTVSVTGFRQEDSICFEIQDDGVGISHEVLHTLNEQNFDSLNLKGSKGIYNVNKRLFYFFRNSFSIEVQSDYLKGTCFKITIPV